MIRSAPYSVKPDFVSPLDPGGARSTRFMQGRVSAGLAGLFHAFDPSMPVTEPATRAIDVAREQIGLEPVRRTVTISPGMVIDDPTTPREPVENGMEITQENGAPLDVEFVPPPAICEETAFRNPDCTMKPMPLIGGLVVGAVVLTMLMR